MNTGSSPSPARRRNPKWLNLTLLLGIAMALLATFGIIFQTIQSERAERDQVRKTTRILVLLRDIDQAALQAESGQRGYLITLDRSYLQPYDRGKQTLLPSIEQLHTILGDTASPRQGELLNGIKAEAEAKIEELDQAIALAENGAMSAARDVVRTGEGQGAMVRLQEAIGEMESIEQALLNQAIADAQSAEDRTPWLVLGLLGLVLVLLAFVIRLIGRAAQSDAEAAQAAALAHARDRADLLANELNHRVKNLFAMILAIVQMSGKGSPDASDVLQTVSLRIRALLTAHDVTQGSVDGKLGSLQSLVETTLSPYRSAENPAEIQGPEVLLPINKVTPLGLVLHELTTNAIKYGAWAHGGTVSVSWERQGDTVQIDWHEDGLEALRDSEHRGFGSQLMDGAARQLSGTIERVFQPHGCEVSIRFPIDAGSNLT